jgi:hypothetical protein
LGAAERALGSGLSPDRLRKGLGLLLFRTAPGRCGAITFRPTARRRGRFCFAPRAGAQVPAKLPELIAAFAGRCQ